jgi:hypothetical protein
MVMRVNMHEAKTQFSKLAKLVESGEQVFVARSGKVMMAVARANGLGLITADKKILNLELDWVVDATT